LLVDRRIRIRSQSQIPRTNKIWIRMRIQEAQKHTDPNCVQVIKTVGSESGPGGDHKAQVMISSFYKLSCGTHRKRAESLHVTASRGPLSYSPLYRIQGCPPPPPTPHLSVGCGIKQNSFRLTLLIQARLGKYTNFISTFC
jgi:hypothetical protein